MRASGIRSYHRPNRLAEALDLVARGVVPVAGGTRLFAQDHEIANVLDLAALGLDAIEMDDGDLRLGAMVTLQGAADSPVAHGATAGLLPAACLAQQPSRMVRNLATLGGESVFAAHDSEVAAALLALNAVFVVDCPDGPIESPAVRFLRNPAEDMAGGLLTSLFIPGAPEGAALERVAVLPSAPALVAVAVDGLVLGRQLLARAHRRHRPHRRAGARDGGGGEDREHARGGEGHRARGRAGGRAGRLPRRRARARGLPARRSPAC